MLLCGLDVYQCDHTATGLPNCQKSERVAETHQTPILGVTVSAAR